jgi:hypothetical protein
MAEQEPPKKRVRFAASPEVVVFAGDGDAPAGGAAAGEEAGSRHRV